jgi:hypothetical protein
MEVTPNVSGGGTEGCSPIECAIYVFQVNFRAFLLRCEKY